MTHLRATLAISLATLGSAGVQAATFTIQKAFASQVVSGVETPYTPRVGEPYRIALTYTQTGVTAPYDIRFNIGGYKPVKNGVQVFPTLHITDLTPGTKTVAVQENVDLDDSVPVVITIDPGNADRKVRRFDFTPTPPSTAIEFYDTHEVTGVQDSIYDIKRTGPFDFTFLTSIPCTDGWQKLLSNKCTVELTPGGTENVGEVKNEGPWPNPLNYWKGKNLKVKRLTFHQTFKLQLSNQRVNPDLLRQVKWAQYDAMKGVDVFNHFIQAEPVVESKDPIIAKFVKDTLGDNYRAHYTPYDAARKLFIAVSGWCTYTFPENGGPDKRAKTAAEMCKTHLGDCGGYAIFLTAVFRNIGIPARSSVGGWEPSGGHCWTEMFFPNAGWIVSDACAASTNSDHKTALWFGVLGDLADRYAQERGNEFDYKGIHTEWLQSPMWTPIITPSQEFTASGSTTLAEFSPKPKKKRSFHLRDSLQDFDAKTLQRVSKG